MAKSLIINGISFRPGQVKWEDAFSNMRSALPDFATLRANHKAIGKMITSVGLVARVGTYWIVISEHGSAEGIFDFTIVPIQPKVKVAWTGSLQRKIGKSKKVKG